jgi:hypothetical protein
MRKLALESKKRKLRKRGKKESFPAYAPSSAIAISTSACKSTI